VNKPASPYRRILLKLSGEALMGNADYGIDTSTLKRITAEIIEAQNLGVEIGVVIGGGNIFRGAGLSKAGMDRVTGDHMGMLATMINSLALQDGIERMGGHVRVMSALQIHQISDDYIRRRAVRHLEKGRVTIFSAGTGNPFFTTDTAAALRAIEIGADLLLQGTKVDGVCSADPTRDRDAQRYEDVTFDKVLSDKLQVMDATAIVMCRDNGLPIRVFDLSVPGALVQLVGGSSIGTLVHDG